MEKANLGMAGLGIMGHMLALNIERNGFRVAGYDLDAGKMADFGEKNPGKNLVLDPEFAAALNSHENSLRRVVGMATQSGIPVLAFSSALAYYDAYRSARLLANLTQAQRDYFRAHTYRRLDREGIFHTQWVGE